MATIAQLVAAIRDAIYGKDVRESIAQAIEGINTTVNTAVANQIIQYKDVLPSDAANHRGTISTGDLNDCFGDDYVGLWTLNTANVDNVPGGITTGLGWLFILRIVKWSTGARYYQIYTPGTAGGVRFFVRQYDTDVAEWTTWKELARADDVAADIEDVYRGVLPADVNHRRGVITTGNLDSYKGDLYLGLWTVNNAETTVYNIPQNFVTAFGWLYVMRVAVWTGGGRYYQIYTPTTSSQMRIFLRLYDTQTNTWSPWRELANTDNVPQIDDTLSMPGYAADAAAVGEALAGSGLSADAKTALLACFQHVAWTDEHGQDYYDALYEALYDTTWPITQNLTYCTSSNAATDVAKGGAFSATITASAGYVMEGATVSITMGGTDITASAYSGGVITIPSVTGALVISVTAAPKTISSIEAAFTQSGTVYDTDNLDDLKDDLVVTATYTDSSTATVPAAGYTLSGTLTAGTSTVTVTCGGKTTTFSVTVTFFFVRGYAVQRNTASATPASGAYKLVSSDGDIRAVGMFPVANNNNTYTVTDTSIYQINVVPITSDEKKYTSVPSAAVDGYWYQSNTESVSWGATFTRTTPFVWVCLRKTNNVSFTDAELANGAAAVFTVT